MMRKIINIDKEKCNGCGACAVACHEGAIEMIDGKATLTREDFCDGLGDCLPACPVGAISFEVREAPEYDEAAVKRAQMKKRSPCSCPGTEAKLFARPVAAQRKSPPSQLMQWPCQIKLVPANAPYLDGAHLLIAADCTAYAYGNFHDDFIKGRITLIGCPKLDAGDYAEKLTAIISNNAIKSITVTRMEVPCCSGLENAVKRALMSSKKRIPLSIITISTDGRITD